jgi:hypothetical protein
MSSPELIGNDTNATAAGGAELHHFSSVCNAHLEVLQGAFKRFATANQGHLRDQAILEQGKIDQIQQQNNTIASSLGGAVETGGQNLYATDVRAGDNIMSS